MKQQNMGFEETELRLGIGLPRNGGEGGEAVRKRGFSETQTDDDNNSSVDLKLNLSSSKEASDLTHQPKEKTLLPPDPAKPPAKYVIPSFSYIYVYTSYPYYSLFLNHVFYTQN